MPKTRDLLIFVWTTAMTTTTQQMTEPITLPLVHARDVTTAPANLKPLARITHTIHVGLHCYVARLHTEVHILAVYAKYMYVASSNKSMSLKGCQNTQTRAAANVSMEKNENTTISKAH